MTRDEAQVLVADTIRDRVFDGDDRELPLDAALTELGFDSFALVTVVSGLEAAVGRSFPEEYWEARPSLRVADLVEAVERLGAQRAEPSFDVMQPREEIGASQAGSLLRAAARSLQRRAYSRLDVVLIERSLGDVLPQQAPPPGVALRRATTADAEALATLWPRAVRAGKLRRLRAWLSEGYLALAAFEGDRAVALDWLHHSDPTGGVVAEHGTCLGIDLRVRSGGADRGVGLALLAYSLHVARSEGYVRQAAYVARDNHLMRTACIGLLGFAEIGTARRTTSLGRTRWTWARDGTSGSGAVLPL